jgi:uncharacterized membrane protein YbaN (DUF454 family)
MMVNVEMYTSFVLLFGACFDRRFPFFKRMKWSGLHNGRYFCGGKEARQIVDDKATTTAVR